MCLSNALNYAYDGIFSGVNIEWIPDGLSLQTCMQMKKLWLQMSFMLIFFQIRMIVSKTLLYNTNEDICVTALYSS